MLKIPKFLLFLFFQTSLAFFRSDITPLITGGIPGDNQFLAKYIVSLRYDEPLLSYGDNHFCGGSIIGAKKILTAGHCVTTKGKVNNPYDINVVTGCIYRLQWSEHMQKYQVSSIILHPLFRMDFESGIIMADIAVLILDSVIHLDGRITDIVPLVTETPNANTLCTVLGWGTLFEYGPLANELLFVNLSIWTYEKCRQIEPGMSPGFICAGDADDNTKGSCQGDSGGPLICEGYLTGVVSFGFGCGYSSDVADFYTEVACFREWIMEIDVQNLAAHYKFSTFISILLTVYFLFWKIV